MKRALYLDCFSGISGNMLLGLFLDLGWPETDLISLPQRLGLPEVSIDISRVKRGSLSGIHVAVSCDNDQPFRDLNTVKDLLGQADLPVQVQREALTVFQILAQAEARVHGVAVEQVHFHEIGAVDALVDIAGACLALHSMGIQEVYCSSLPIARGWIMSAHGRIPLPAPAVMEILRDIPLQWECDPARESFEFVTPTGAALVKSIACFSPMPSGFMVTDTGYGAGTKNPQEFPNLLRGFLCNSDSKATIFPHTTDRIIEMRTVIDDESPEILACLVQKLLDAGGLDCWQVPVLMKKGRSGVELVCLVPEAHQDQIARLILQESSSSGLRVYPVSRILLEREIGNVETRWGAVRVKMIRRPDGTVETAPEYEECARIAREFKIPLRRVYREVIRASIGKDQW